MSWCLPRLDEALASLITDLNDRGLLERTLVGMVAELSEMISAVRENRPPSVTGEDGRAGLAATLAVYASSATGKWVEVG